MKKFHIDEPREIGKKKERLSRKDFMDIKDDLTERVVRELIRKEIKSINEDLTPLRKIYSDLDKKFPKHNPDKISDVNKIVKFLGRKLKPGSQISHLIASFYNDYRSGEDISKNQKRFFKYTKKMSKKESVNESKKEFVIWGIPPKKSSEEILYTKAKSHSEAKKVVKILTKKHGVAKARIQVLDLEQDPLKFWKSDKVFESLLLEFDKYRLGGLLDSKLKKRLERTIKVIGGKVDAVGNDYIKFRMSDSGLVRLPAVIKKLDRNKNVWIGDRYKTNIWDRRKNIDKIFGIDEKILIGLVKVNKKYKKGYTIQVFLRLSF